MTHHGTCWTCDWTTSGDPAVVDRAAEKHVRDHTHCVSSGTSEWRRT